jgi:uncharacterized protein involved in outer membrane biogenesis
MAIRRKTIIVVTVIIAAAMSAVALLLPILANPDRYRSEVISYLEAKTGKQIEVGHIGLNWIPLSIRLDNFGARNPKPFPSGYLLKAAGMDAAIDAVALLHRQIVIKSMVLHDPIINVISDPDGLWNFENLPSKASQERVPIFALGVISRVETSGGQLFAYALPPHIRPLKSATSNLTELREFRFARVLSDQALAPERRNFRDRPAVPLLAEAKGLGIGAR